MNKQGFEKLLIEKQVEYINSQLLSKSLRNVSKELNIARSTLSARFKKEGYKFDSEANKYILGSQYNNNSIQNKQNTNEREIEKQYNRNSIEYKGIEELLYMKDKLKLMLSWFESEKDELKLNDLVLDLEKFEGKAVNRTFVIYENVLKEYKNFCDEYKEFKKQDLMSQALIEFMERHRKKIK